MINRTKLAGMVLISSAVLGMAVNTGVTSAFAAEPQAVSSGAPANNQRGIQFQTQGTLSLSSTAMDGLELSADNTVTEGVLHLDYEVKSVASINWNDHTFATIKLPRELNQFAQDKTLLAYIKEANFKYHSIISINHDYTADEMSIVKDTENEDTYLLKFKNPTLTGAGLFTSMDVNFNLDLGAMVTKTGHRIPDAYNKSTYDFASTIASEEESIDWELVGNTNGEKSIALSVLDPGYQIQQQKPVIMDPVYNTDTIVRGSAIPGAKVVIYRGTGANRVKLGEATADAKGFYSVTIVKQNAGVVIYATQNAGVGESPDAETTIQEKVTEIPAPTVNSTIGVDSKSVTGKGSYVGDEITVTNSRTGESVKTIVGADLSFSVNVTDGFWKVYDILHVQESNDAGVQSAIAEIVVIP